MIDKKFVTGGGKYALPYGDRFEQQSLYKV